MNESPSTGSQDLTESSASARQAKPLAIKKPETEQKFRVGVGARLYFVLFGAVVLMGGATLLAYFSFNETLRHEIQLAEYSMPNLINSVDVARKSAIVVNGAFRLVSASSKEEHAAVVEAMAQETASLENTILGLEARSAFGEQTQLIKTHLEEFGKHLDVIQQSSARRLDIEQALNVFIDELGETTRRVERLLVQAIDDQAFYLVSGLRQLDEKSSPISERASEDELTAYRNLITVNQSANLAVLLLDEVLVLADRQFLTPLKERFDSAVRNFLHAYSTLPASMQDNRLKENLTRLSEIGQGPEGSHCATPRSAAQAGTGAGHLGKGGNHLGITCVRNQQSGCADQHGGHSIQRGFPRRRPNGDIPADSPQRFRHHRRVCLRLAVREALSGTPSGGTVQRNARDGQG